jgi:hypothetical protein
MADDDYEPDPADLTRAELAEYAHQPWAAVAETLDEWNARMHGTFSSAHGAGLLLDLLALHGWEVTPKPAVPPLDQLLPASTA